MVGVCGVVKELKVKPGDKMKEGSVVLVLEAAGEAFAPVLEKMVIAAVKYRMFAIYNVVCKPCMFFHKVDAFVVLGESFAAQSPRHPLVDEGCV